MKPICVIPARRGSKRLALKNILPLAGKPMVAYSIEAALSSGLFDRVFVSTEDDEIGEIASRYGATVHKRPVELADDLVSATDVCIDLINAQNALGAGYDSIYCLQPSSPLRTAADICGAWEQFVKTGANYLVSVTFIDPHYFHWAIQQQNDGSGWWEMYFGDKYMIERPLLPPVYRPNGSIKIGLIEPTIERRNFFGPHLTMYETPEDRSVHVAEQFDFDLAEFLLSRRSK
ncbi:MAG: acylneuraminate cytidylyltransferase family protein [Chloroflexota bacterium]